MTRVRTLGAMAISAAMFLVSKQADAFSYSLGDAYQASSFASVFTNSLSQCAAGGVAHPGCPAAPQDVNDPLSVSDGDSVTSAKVTVDPNQINSYGTVKPVISVDAEIKSGGYEAQADGSVAFTLEITNKNPNPFDETPPPTILPFKVEVVGGDTVYDNAGPIPVGNVNVSILDPRGPSGDGYVLDWSSLVVTSYDPTTGKPVPKTAGFDQTITLYSGVFYQVSLSAAVNLSTGVPDCCEVYPAEADATVDPTFSIDPSNPDAADYVIAVSSNLAPAFGTGVPEPSTWAMLLLGFVGLGFPGYRASRENLAVVA